jgi:hypothetical protein
MNNQIKDLDALALFSTFLGVLNYTENLKQTSNDDLMTELKYQNKDFLQTIINQNEEILKSLKELMEIGNK